ncbi:MAG: hypothetical protein ACYC09_14050 [Bacteroidota bacterium]
MTKSSSKSPDSSHHLPKLQELNFSDFLSESTRKEKRALLGISVIAIAIVQTGLLPTKISALGIEFQLNDQRALLLLMVFVVVYFLIAFTMHASTDFIRWRVVYNSTLLDNLINEHARPEPPEYEDEDPYERTLNKVDRAISLWFRMAQHLTIGRAFWDFFFPFLFALYTITVLMIARYTIS